MKAHHFGVLAITLLLLGLLAGYSLVKNSIFPVAWVNGELLFLKDVEDNMRVSRTILANAPEAAGAELSEETDPYALFARTFESLIVHTIVRTSATDEERQSAESTVDSYLEGSSDEHLGASLHALYEWDLGTYRTRVLEPKALEELLIERKGTGEFEAWLEAVRREANVKIWFQPFEWRNGALVPKT
jgi:hypothetical protein